MTIFWDAAAQLCANVNNNFTPMIIYEDEVPRLLEDQRYSFFRIIHDCSVDSLMTFNIIREYLNIRMMNFTCLGVTDKTELASKISERDDGDFNMIILLNCGGDLDLS